MTTDKANPAVGSILVVGGGISGLTTTLEAAEVGYEVYVVEKNPYLGGRVSQLNQYFPKLCPPTCGLEINYRRIKDNPKIKVMTLTEVEKVEGEPGNYEVTLKLSPRFVNEKCTVCGDCAKVCSGEVDNEFNFGMDKTKAAYLPNDMAFPMRYVLSADISAEDGKKCEEACKYGAIDLTMEPKTMTINVGAVVWATGWKPYDATKIENLGFGQHKNIITNMITKNQYFFAINFFNFSAITFRENNLIAHFNV